jgi:hypothetical protein
MGYNINMMVDQRSLILEDSISTVETISNSISTTITFSKPKVIQKENFISIQLQEANSNCLVTGKPYLPAITKVFEFEFGTKIKSIEVTFSEPKIKQLAKPVELSPNIQTISTISCSNDEKLVDDICYEDQGFYPKNRYSYKKFAGKNEEKHVIICAVSIFPVQYNQKENILSYVESADVKINYTSPEHPVIFPDIYDLLILTPDEFVYPLQVLKNHKEERNIRTKIVTLEEIPSQGVDIQEDIKLFIKDAIESWGIDYVILVGSSLLGEAKFPFRYAWIGDSIEDFFPSDLYFADIYDSDGNFSNWDFDEDGKYAEYPEDFPDVDAVPDIFLGKIPCDNILELSAYIDKVKWYDNHNLMTNRIIQVGGDTIPGDGGGILEGEYANQQVLKELPGYISVRLWASLWLITKNNIARNYEFLPDFYDFSGHGSFSTWATHPPERADLWIPANTSTSEEGGWRYVDFDLYNVKNPGKYPIIFSNACSNNKYHKLKDCLSWKSIRHPRGGGIIAFGSSGIASAVWGTDITERLFGWMEVHCFKELYKTKNLGQVWSNCVKDYYSTFAGSMGKKDYKTILEFSMFGDPTLIAQDGDDPKTRSIDNINELRFFDYFPLFQRLLDLLNLISY